MVKTLQENGDGFFYTAKITLRNGKVLYARDCGLKAFKIRKKEPESPKEKPEKQ